MRAAARRDGAARLLSTAFTRESSLIFIFIAALLPVFTSDGDATDRAASEERSDISNLTNELECRDAGREGRARAGRVRCHTRRSALRGSLSLCASSKLQQVVRPERIVQ